jgi:phytanoyl-CoA hydroxylase
MTQTTCIPYLLSPEQLEGYRRDGFIVIRGLYSTEEVEIIREHFMAMQREALDRTSEVAPFYHPLDELQSGGDVLKQFPRVMHPHRFDELSKHYMLDARVQIVLKQLFGEEALASQSMFYYKPAGAKGQALHQDNFYLNVRPGTCMAAWLAIDAADADNGGMFVVPGSHEHGVLCPTMADMEQSFTTELVEVPEGLEAVQIPLAAGDVLFFNGATIHGSTPNTTKDRFRRAFICHYVPESMTAMNGMYYPLHDFNGNVIERGWVEGQLNTCGAEDWETFNRLRNDWMKSQKKADVSVH